MTTATPVGIHKREPTPGSPPGSRSRGILRKNDFLLRRLHSLSGILPIGVFVIFHLFTNAQMVWGDQGESFQHEVDFIHSMPALYIIEMSLWGAIAFHAIVGVWITMTGVSNATRYQYADNWRYTAQRVTGIIALIFIFLHVAILRWRWDIFGWYSPFYGRVPADMLAEGEFTAELQQDVEGTPMSMPLTAYALQMSWVVLLFYVVGVTSSVFHWANGLWTAAITWGVTISTASMKRWGYVCIGLFVFLMVSFGAAVVGALKYDLGHDMTPAQAEVFNILVPEPAMDIDVTGRSRDGH